MSWLTLSLLLACGEGQQSAPEPAPAVPAAEPAQKPMPARIVSDPCDPVVAWSPPTREATSPLGRALNNEELAALNTLTDVVTTHGSDPNNPWAISHALLALGPDLVLSNGQGAVDWLFAEYAEVQRLADGQKGLAFPARRGQIRIEPHADLLLKALTETGVAHDRPVSVKGEPFSVSDLYRRSLCATWTDGDLVSHQSWNDTPWGLQGLSAWAPAGLEWSADGGKGMTMSGLTDNVVAKLQEETAFLREAKASGAAVQKRKQGIFSYTCGGAHLLQGATFAVGRGFGSDGSRAAVIEELEVHTWRLDLELKAVDGLVDKHPEYRDLLLVQRLKFTGHYLETLHKGAALGLYTDDAAHRAAIERGATEVVNTVNSLMDAGSFAKMDSFKTSNEQLYLDLIGDSAHAIRGLKLHSGEGVLRY